LDADAQGLMMYDDSMLQGVIGCRTGVVTRSRARKAESTLEQVQPAASAALANLAAAPDSTNDQVGSLARNPRSRAGAVPANYDGSAPMRGDAAAIRMDNLEQYVNQLAERDRQVAMLSPRVTPAQQADRAYLDTPADMSIISPRQQCDCDGFGMAIPAAAVSEFPHYWFSSTAAWGTKNSVRRQQLRSGFTACIATRPVHLYVCENAVTPIRQHINLVSNRMHAAAVSPAMLTKQPLQYASDVLLAALIAANVKEVFIQHLGAKQSVASAVLLINRLQSHRGSAEAWPPVSLDIARTFPTRMANGTSVDALQLDIVMDAVGGTNAAGSESDGDSEGDGTAPQTGMATAVTDDRSAVRDPLTFNPSIPRVRGTFANGAAAFALHPFLGVLGDIPSGGFRLTLKVILYRHTFNYTFNLRPNVLTTICAQKPNPEGVSDVTWYTQLHHLQNGHFSPLSPRQGSDIGSTAATARSIMDKAVTMLACFERGIIHDTAEDTVWDAGGLRVEVRATVHVPGRLLSVADLQHELGPWLSLASQQQKLQEYVDTHSTGTIVIRKQEFTSQVVMRQANMCLFLLAKGLQAGRTKLTVKSKFVLLLLASCIGYSNPRWYATFLSMAAASAERRLLKQIYQGIYNSSLDTAGSIMFAFRTPAMPQVRTRRVSSLWFGYNQPY
jgi:hypothetical protein